MVPNGVRIHSRQFESNQVSINNVRVNLVGAVFLPFIKSPGTAGVQLILSPLKIFHVCVPFTEFTLLDMFIILVNGHRIHAMR